MSLRRRLGRAAGLSLAGSAVTVAANYGRSWLGARLLGVEQLGLLAAASTVVTWASCLFGLGLGNSISKYMAERSSRGEPVGPSARWALRAGALSGAAGGVLVGVAARFLSGWLGLAERLPSILWVLSLVVPATVLLQVANGVSTGLGAVGNAVATGGLLLPLAWLGLVGLALAWGSGARGVAAAQSLATLAAALAASALARRQARRGGPRAGVTAPAGLFAVGGALFVASAANNLWLYLHNVFLGHYWGAREVGLYAVPFQLAYTLTLFIVAVSTYFFPAVAALNAGGRTTELAGLYRELNLWCAWANLAPAAVMWFGAAELLNLFGPDFAVPQAVWSLRILAAGFLAYSLVGAMPSVVLAAGWHRAAAGVEVSVVPAALVLNAWLTRGYGVVGAAGSSVGALLLAGVLRGCWVRARLGVWGWDRSAATWLRAAALVAAACAIVSQATRGRPAAVVLPALVIVAVAAEAAGWLAGRAGLRFGLAESARVSGGHS